MGWYKDYLSKADITKRSLHFSKQRLPKFSIGKLKAEGYDGIVYKSSLNEDGHNIALFDSQKAKCIMCRMYGIKKVTYGYEELGNPTFLSNDRRNLREQNRGY
ncbi:MAG: RES family NAD+ phosphorylase [Nitrosomonas sp.]|nr:RES family NAD+ phosphorylase [Nitrosomonas sp.]